MNTRTPAEVFPPGDFIQEELDAREWAQEDLAKIMGKPLPTINRIIKGKSSITPDTAKCLAAVFGTSAQFWLNLEASWQLHQSSDDPGPAVRERVAIYEMAPVREMVRRGWIRKTQTADELAEELRGHFGVDTLSEVPQLQAAARASTRGEKQSITPEQWAWMCRCRHVSSLVDARKYRKSDLLGAVDELMSLTNDPEQIRHVPRILAEAGVRVVIVQHLSQTKLDGGALHRRPNEPVIGLSLRYGRLDNFWFTLLHEIAHILNRDGVVADSDVDKAGERVDEIEDRANRMAASWLVPQDAIESFIRRTGPLYSTRRIENFSRRMGIHPSIVVGQLKYRGEVDWEKFHRLNVDIRKIARQSTISDGWGDAAPLA